ncbi:hypothetical protein H4219_001091 [Mycoemilia scoparia]|uniref:Phosphatidylinositol transfer protein N-terminal domain-containing protein n=1 Tax=Mycoemilia scoparia TaxID=417184 RepID=A0A9W8DVW5_9FUNG|nr:hypothetical protein H4219_001091 [Mycoemilia scoparia]
MVVVKEYRITNNCTVEEYHIAQLFAVAKMSLQETGGGEGVEVAVNEPYDNEMGKGQYTKKIYYIKSHIPAIVCKVIPEDALVLIEEAWNGYPHCKTILTNKYMKDSFKLITETMHLPDRGETENALGVDKSVLANRKVDFIDVADDSGLESGQYKKTEDPKLYKSEKTGRGLLTEPNWRETCEPHMTCYKLVTAEFKWFGLQTAVESFIHKKMRSMMIAFHRQLYSQTDEWYGMDMEKLRKYEDEVAKELAEKRQKKSMENGKVNGKN